MMKKVIILIFSIILVPLEINYDRCLTRVPSSSLTGIVNSSSSSSCANLIASFIEGKANRSLNSTAKKYKSKIVISHEEYGNWQKKDWLEKAGKVLHFEDYKSRLQPQEILLHDDFTLKEMKLISKISSLAQSKKFKMKGYYNEYLGLVNRYKNTGMSQKQAMELARKTYTDILNEGVEIGAYRITYSDGTIRTAIHTSSEYNTIQPMAFLKSLDSILDSNLPMEKIKHIQYFHNHPGEGGPLSYGDLYNQNKIIDQFQKMGLSINFHMYAITERDGTKLIFHSGKP